MMNETTEQEWLERRIVELEAQLAEETALINQAIGKYLILEKLSNEYRQELVEVAKKIGRLELLHEQQAEETETRPFGRA